MSTPTLWRVRPLTGGDWTYYDFPPKYALADSTKEVQAFAEVDGNGAPAVEPLMGELRNGWISVAERMPPPDTTFLVFFSGDCIGIANTYSKWQHRSWPLGYLIQGHGGSHNDVTHWMPLPGAPKEGGAE